MRILALTMLLILPSLSGAATVPDLLDNLDRLAPQKWDKAAPAPAIQPRVVSDVMALPASMGLKPPAGSITLPNALPMAPYKLGSKITGISFKTNDKFHETHRLILARNSIAAERISDVRTVPLPQTVLSYLAALLFTSILFGRQSFARKIGAYKRRFSSPDARRIKSA